MELLTIIIPVYNVEKYIGECIESVLQQDYSNIEVILVDDGSTDNSGAICDQYAKIDNRVKVFHKKNEGVGVARNFGLQQVNAQTKYIGFVDSDDIVSRKLYSNLYNALSCNKADIGITKFVRINDKHEIIERPCENVIKEGVYSTEEIINMSVGKGGWCFRILCNKLFRKELFDGIEFWENKIHEDEAVAYSLFLSCKKTVCIESEDYYYRVGNTVSIMNNRIKKRNSDLLDAYLYNIHLLVENKFEFAARKIMLRAAREYSSLRHDKYEKSDECKATYNKTLMLMKINRLLSVEEMILCTFLGLCPTLGYKLLITAQKIKK